MAEIFRLFDNTYRIEDSGVRFFLLLGSEKAILIDSGMNTPNAKKIAEGLTNLPLSLVNTHSDPDHVSGNAAFESFYMTESDYEYYVKNGGKGKCLPIKDGDVLDLGDRKLKIIDLAGHTKGSVAILDVNTKTLFSGDSIQDGRIFMFGAHRDIKKYRETLANLLENHISEFDTICPSHSSVTVEKPLIEKLISAADDIIDGKTAPASVDFHGKTIKVHTFPFATFLCD